MTALRQRFIEDLQLHGFAASTQQVYVSAIKLLARHYGQAPDRLTEEQIRQYFLFLNSARKENFHPNVALTIMPPAFTPLVGNQTQRERRSLHRIEENPSRVHFGPISFRPAFEQIGRLAHHHIGTVSFLPPPTEDQFPKPVPVRPPDLVQPDFLRHTLDPSAAKSLNSF